MALANEKQDKWTNIPSEKCASSRRAEWIRATALKERPDSKLKVSELADVGLLDTSPVAQAASLRSTY